MDETLDETLDETFNETLDETLEVPVHSSNTIACLLSPAHGFKETDMQPKDSRNNFTPEQVTEFLNEDSPSEEEEETTKKLPGKNKGAALLNQQKKAAGPKKNTKNVKQISDVIEKAPEIKKQGKSKTKNPTSPIKGIEMESDHVEEEPEIKVKRGKKEKANNANVVDCNVHQNSNNLTDSNKIISEEVDKTKKPKKGARGKKIQATKNVTEISQQNLGIEDELNKMKIDSHLKDQENPKKNIKKSNATAAQYSEEVTKTNSKTTKGKTAKKVVETRENNVAHVSQETNAEERTFRSTRGKPKQEPIVLKETNKLNENGPSSEVILNEDVSTSGRGKRTAKKVTVKPEVQIEHTESKTDEPNPKKKTNNSKQKNSDETTNKEDDTLNKKDNPRSKTGVAKGGKASEKKENDRIITEPAQAPKRATRKK